jgi:hypothetical protein
MARRRKKISAIARRRAVERRISKALKKFVRSNPAVPAAMRKAKALGLRRNKSSVTIRVIKLPKVKR